MYTLVTQTGLRVSVNIGIKRTHTKAKKKKKTNQTNKQTKTIKIILVMHRSEEFQSEHGPN